MLVTLHVADFFVESENTENIQEALAILKQWNSELNPQYILPVRLL